MIEDALLVVGLAPQRLGGARARLGVAAERAIQVAAQIGDLADQRQRPRPLPQPLLGQIGLVLSLVIFERPRADRVERV